MTGPGLDQVAEHRHAESSSSCGAQIALAVVAAVSLFAITFAAVVATSSPSPQLRALPVPGEPIWCACIWGPSGPARTVPA